MPKYSPITIPPGVVRSATSRSTPNRWYDTNLVRWREDVLAPIGGWERIQTDLLASTARTIYGWLAKNESRQIAIVCDGHVYSLWEDRLLDITPADFVPDETSFAIGGFGTWEYGEEDYGVGRLEGEPRDFLTQNVCSADNFGERLLVVTQTDGRLLEFDPSVGPTQVLKPVLAPEGKPPVPRSNRAMLVNPERFVVLIGAEGNSRRVAWSNREDYYDWDFGIQTNEAGFYDCDAASGLITGKSVKGGTLIFSASEVWMMTFIGQPFIYRFDKIEENTSLASGYGIAAFDGRAMWMTRTGFKMFDGGSIKPMQCDLMDFLLKDIDERFWFRTHAVVNNVFSEVSWYYCSKGTNQPTTPTGPILPDDPTASPAIGVPDSYVTYNFERGWWVKGKMSRTAGIPVLINYDPILAGPNGELFRHEVDGVTAFSSPGAGRIFAKSGAITPVPGQMATVNGLLPDSESGFNSTSFRFTTRMTPEAPEITYGPYLPRKDGYMDCRFSARQLEMEVEQIKDGYWTLGTPEFDIKPRGRR